MDSFIFDGFRCLPRRLISFFRESLRQTHGDEKKARVKSNIGTPMDVPCLFSARELARSLNRRAVLLKHFGRTLFSPAPSWKPLGESFLYPHTFYEERARWPSPAIIHLVPGYYALQQSVLTII